MIVLKNKRGTCDSGHEARALLASMNHEQRRRTERAVRVSARGKRVAWTFADGSAVVEHVKRRALR